MIMGVGLTVQSLFKIFMHSPTLNQMGLKVALNIKADEGKVLLHQTPLWSVT